MVKKIVLFNHKGGVSKTTTTFNIGWKMAEKGYKVLLVDADPQCNLSSLFLMDNFDNYYFEDSTKDHNIKDGVRPAFDGKPIPIASINPVSSSRNHNLFLLPGHADLSEYDAALSLAQNSGNAIATLQNLPGAFSALIDLTAQQHGIDLVLIDLNPGLSAINQNLFSISDGFLIPTNPDAFATMAIRTLSKVLPRWADSANRMRSFFPDSSYSMPSSTPKFVGGLIQRFNIRKGRAARPFRDNIDDIKSAFKDTLVPVLKMHNMVFPETAYGIELIENDYNLSEIPDFQGLLPKASDAGVPVFALSDSDIRETGPILDGLKAKRSQFDSLFDSLTDRILEIMNNGAAS